MLIHIRRIRNKLALYPSAVELIKQKEEAAMGKRKSKQSDEDRIVPRRRVKKVDDDKNDGKGKSKAVQVVPVG